MAEAYVAEVRKLNEAFALMHYWEKMEFLKEVGGNVNILSAENNDEAVNKELRGK